MSLPPALIFLFLFHSPKPFFEGEAGSYYKWSPSDHPILAQANVAAGRLLLRPRAFAIPHYSDCSKVGYVLRGYYMLEENLILTNLQNDHKFISKKYNIVILWRVVVSS